MSRGCQHQLPAQELSQVVMVPNHDDSMFSVPPASAPPPLRPSPPEMGDRTRRDPLTGSPPGTRQEHRLFNTMTATAELEPPPARLLRRPCWPFEVRRDLHRPALHPLLERQLIFASYRYLCRAIARQGATPTPPPRVPPLSPPSPSPPKPHSTVDTASSTPIFVFTQRDRPPVRTPARRFRVAKRTLLTQAESTAPAPAESCIPVKPCRTPTGPHSASSVLPLTLVELPLAPSAHVVQCTAPDRCYSSLTGQDPVSPSLPSPAVSAPSASLMHCTASVKPCSAEARPHAAPPMSTPTQTPVQTPVRPPARPRHRLRPRKWTCFSLLKTLLQLLLPALHPQILPPVRLRLPIPIFKHLSHPPIGQAYNASDFSKELLVGTDPYG